VLKTRRLGYDGKGQFVIRDPSQIEPAFNAIGGTPLILESFVPFDRELSIIAVRGRDGQMCTYPLVENHHAGGILRASYAPAPGITPQQQHTAATLAEHILTRLAYIGVLAIELFDVRGVLVANEMAPRVHNSGHWTIEGAATSQFENHLRAICGLPLGDCSPRGYSAMLNLIGDTPPLREMLAIGGARIHLYGKDPRPGRKIGHVTVTHDDPAIVRHAVSQLQMLIAANEPPSTPS
jgi:5-(carboxyamino)imidazole ribonucleotide synthase